jgi:hypothetical protein
VLGSNSQAWAPLQHLVRSDCSQWVAFMEVWAEDNPQVGIHYSGEDSLLRRGFIPQARMPLSLEHRRVVNAKVACWLTLQPSTMQLTVQSAGCVDSCCRGPRPHQVVDVGVRLPPGEVVLDGGQVGVQDGPPVEDGVAQQGLVGQEGGPLAHVGGREAAGQEGHQLAGAAACRQAGESGWSEEVRGRWLEGGDCGCGVGGCWRQLRPVWSVVMRLLGRVAQHEAHGRKGWRRRVVP